MQWGQIVGVTTGLNGDGITNVLLLSVRLNDEDDIQTVEVIMDAGVDYSPSVGAQALVAMVDDSDLVCVGIDDGITPESSPGEYEIYSTDGMTPTKQATVKLDNDGNVKINGGGRSVARVDDEIVINVVTDTAWMAWVATVSGVAGISPPPTSITGKITTATASCEVADD